MPNAGKKDYLALLSFILKILFLLIPYFIIIILLSSLTGAFFQVLSLFFKEKTFIMIMIALGILVLIISRRKKDKKPYN